MTKIFLLALCLVATACQNEAPAPTDAISGPAPRVLPSDTTALWLSDGDVASDTVLISCQGGPTSSLGFQREHKSSLRYLPAYKRYHTAFLHQSQTINPEVYSRDQAMTIDDAHHEVAMTSEILNRAVQYFKKRQKTVIVVGISYGAFVVQHYLSTHASEADRYVIIGGRLDMTEAMVDETLAGWAGHFEEDGSTYVPAERVFPDDHPVQAARETRLENLLKAAIGVPRYTQDLADIDLSNVAYFYATNDQAVGALTPQEVDFLEANGVAVYPTHDGHREITFRFIDAVMAGDLVL